VNNLALSAAHSPLAPGGIKSSTGPLHGRQARLNDWRMSHLCQFTESPPEVAAGACVGTVAPWNPRDLVGKAKPVITAPTPAELHEIFLG